MIAPTPDQEWPESDGLWGFASGPVSLVRTAARDFIGFALSRTDFWELFVGYRTKKRSRGCRNCALIAEFRR